jgi:dihydroorotate dehydrogenase (fumarate)
VSLALTTGVHESEDVVRALLAGADAAMSAAALIRHGRQRLAEMLEGVERWLEEHEFESVEQLKGSIEPAVVCPEPAAFELAHYMRMISTFNTSRT